MIRRLPLIVGAVAALAALLLLGPVAIAVALLRSSSDAHGPSLAAQILIFLIVLGLAALAGFIGWGATRLVLKALGR